MKASLLLSRIAEREAINATRDEVDKEVERMARQQREPFAAVRLRFEKDGTLGRIASHIQTEKTLNFLFEHAQKTARNNPDGVRESLQTKVCNGINAIQCLIASGGGSGDNEMAFLKVNCARSSHFPRGSDGGS